MDTIAFKLMFCLSLAFAEFTTKNGQWSPQSTVTIQTVLNNTTTGTSLNSSEVSTATLTTVIPDTTLTSVAVDNTSTTVTNSSHAHTLESTTTLKSSNSTSESTAATATQTETHSESHTHNSTPTTAATTANSSVFTTTFKAVLSTQGARLSISERNLTIAFSVMLGLFALAVAALKCHKLSNQLHFRHQPLDDTEDLMEPDTHAITGGFSEGHPIYDNVPPPARQNEDQFCLEFLH